MRIHTEIVYSFGEYLDTISKIGKQANDKGFNKPPVLWFRGLSDIDHTLIPSLFRQKIRVETKGLKGEYSCMHYAEDIRTQNYIAKNYHFFEKEPSSRVEWLEVMQHHEMNTRVLDWSESSIHSLIFALEPFLNDRKYTEYTRRTCVPCVWILEPGKLNTEIFNYLSRQVEYRTKLIREIIEELQLESYEEELFSSMEKFVDQDFHTSSETGHLDYILNLSAINDEILRDRSRIKYLLCKGDIINPYYYLLSRIYSDGKILEDRVLPPLAVVHPYHSERIKAQKGVFTVFPFYREKRKDNAARAMAVNPDAMENNIMAEKCLHKIILSSPQKIAYELLVNGMNNSWLYPEMPIVANELERHQIYC